MQTPNSFNEIFHALYLEKGITVKNAGSYKTRMNSRYRYYLYQSLFVYLCRWICFAFIEPFAGYSSVYFISIL